MRTLSLAAVLLALADAALFAVWLQRDETPVPSEANDTPARATAAERSEAVTAHVTPRATWSTEVDAPAPDVDAQTTTGRAVVFGTVTRADGTQPPRGWIALERGDARATTGLQGANGYALAGVEAGAWTLRATFRDDLPVMATVDVHAPRTRFDVVLPAAARLPVYAVTPAGEPLVDALAKADPTTRAFPPSNVLAFCEPLQRDLPLSNGRERGGGIGEFRVAIGWPGGVGKAEAIGVLALPRGGAAHAVLLLRSAVIAQVPVAANATDVTFTVDPEAVFARMATVRARIVDEAGAPKQDGRLLFDHPTIPGGVPVDANGRITCRVPPGLLDVDVMPGFTRLGRIAAEPGATIDLGDLVAARPTPGRNVVLTLEPAMDATFVLTELEPPRGAIWRPTFEEGRVTAGHGWLQLRPGRRSLWVASATHAAMIEIDLRTMPPLTHANAMDGFPLTVQLQPAPPVRVEWRTGAGRTNVTIRAANGGIALERDCVGSGSQELRLPTGMYDVLLHGMRGETAQRLLVGAEGATIAIE